MAFESRRVIGAKLVMTGTKKMAVTVSSSHSIPQDASRVSLFRAEGENVANFRKLSNKTMFFRKNQTLLITISPVNILETMKMQDRRTGMESSSSPPMVHLTLFVIYTLTTIICHRQADGKSNMQRNVNEKQCCKYERKC